MSTVPGGLPQGRSYQDSRGYEIASETIFGSIRDASRRPDDRVSP